jgi:excisionase family DNA binding protein
VPEAAEDTGATAARPVRKPTTGAGPVLLLSVEEAARSLSISRSKTWELIAAGELEAVHIGRSTRVAVSALHELLDRLPRAADG